MIIGLGLDGRLGLSVRELGELGAEAASLGFESLWTPAGGVPDAFHVCARWAETTSSVKAGGLRLGTGVIPAARSWPPLTLANQAATVGQIADGKFILGIGTGGAGQAFFSAAKMPNRPIAVMADYLNVLRALLGGEVVNYEGPVIQMSSVSLGVRDLSVPVYLAALGPQMLRLAGRAADGAVLNWASPENIIWSAQQIADAAQQAGRAPSEVTVSMYIRVCIDEDVDAARKAFAAQVLSYGLARPAQDKTLGYRGHFARMGFDEVFTDLEARREKGASMDELIANVPDELLNLVGYFGSAEGAAARFAELSRGLDETIVRVVSVKPGQGGARKAMQALTPAAIRAVS